MGLAYSTVSLLDSVWPRVRGRLDGLNDAEYLWEPVPGCWSVRRRGDSWEIERDVGPPDPSPVTTIAWRMWHIASECVDGFAQLAFQTKALDLGEREWYPSASVALTATDKAWASFSDCYGGLDDEAIGRELGPAFGPFASSNRADLLLHVADEVIHHGSEIALLRDLYVARDGSPL